MRPGFGAYRLPPSRLTVQVVFPNRALRSAITAWRLSNGLREAPIPPPTRGGVFGTPKQSTFGQVCVCVCAGGEVYMGESVSEGGRSIEGQVR